MVIPKSKDMSISLFTALLFLILLMVRTKRKQLNEEELEHR